MSQRTHVHVITDPGSTSGGFQDDHAPWSTYHCPACLQPIWPPTVSWSPTKVVVSCVLPHQGRALSDGPTATMETAVF